MTRPSSLDLERALRASSSRLSPPPTPWPSVAIHAGVLLAWIGVVAAAALHGVGVAAWAAGCFYIAYDTLQQLFVGWHTWKLLRPQRVATAPPAAPCRVAVIVAAHDEALVLPATLAALFAQTEPPDEILIADDGSTDDTARVLAAHHGLAEPPLGCVSAHPASLPTLRWLRVPHGGKARALNAALLHVTAEVVLTVDADTLLDARAVAAVRRAFAAEPELAAVTGVITPLCRPTPMGRVLERFQTGEYIRNFLARHAWMQVDALLLISGAFAGLRRDAVLAVGGFDPDCLVEDYELIHRLRRHAVAHGLTWRFRVLGDAQARTEAPGSVAAFLRQRRRWFGGFLETQAWYRAMVGDRRHGWLGLVMLPIKSFDTFQPIYGCTALASLAFYAVTGRFDVLVPAGALVTAKVVFDLAFHLWSLHLYRRWVGNAANASFAGTLLAALAEPFSFQFLLQGGALLGWFAFLSGRGRWGRQARFGLGRQESGALEDAA